MLLFVDGSSHREMTLDKSAPNTNQPRAVPNLAAFISNVLRRMGMTALIALGMSALPAQAAIIISVDRATFQLAVAGGMIAQQDFDSLAVGTILGVTPDVTYSASSGSPIVTNSFLTSTPPNGLGATVFGFFLPDDNVTFTFTAPITAFAIDVNTFAATNGAYRATLNTGDIITSIFEVFPGNTTGQFIGFASDSPFTSVTISAVTGFSYTLDTLVYGDAGAMPEPETLALLGIATAIFAWRRRKR